MQARFHRNIAASSLAADCNVPQRPPAVIRSFYIYPDGTRTQKHKQKKKMMKTRINASMFQKCRWLSSVESFSSQCALQYYSLELSAASTSPTASRRATCRLEFLVFMLHGYVKCGSVVMFWRLLRLFQYLFAGHSSVRKNIQPKCFNIAIS